MCESHICSFSDLTNKENQIKSRHKTERKQQFDRCSYLYKLNEITHSNQSTFDRSIQAIYRNSCATSKKKKEKKKSELSHLGLKTSSSL